MKQSFWDGLKHWNIGANVQITTTPPNGAHSESSVAANPLNSKNLVAVSKNFTDRANYIMTVTPSYSLDGGKSWTATPLTLPQDWGGMTDPDIVFTPSGVAVLMTEGLAYTPNTGDEGITTLAMVVFRSLDGGKTWSGPTPLHSGDPSDDKGWIACDTLAGSPYNGRLYSVWGASSPIRFARSVDGGVTWQGAGGAPSGSELAGEGFAPAICSGPDGVIHIAWHDPGSSVINYIQSSDGGDSFSSVRTIASGVTSLTSALPQTDGWPHFPGATFRVMTLCTIVATKDNSVNVAWADMREGVSRIYQVWSTDSGKNWQGGVSGHRLLSNYPVDQQHHFHPQLSTADPRTLACAFYEFGPKPVAMGIDVRLTTKAPGDAAFVAPGTVTDQPWDPSVAAPYSHGDKNVTFIGEYFGLAGTNNELFPVWTDTRTGLQDLFCAAVVGRSFFPPPPVWPPLPWPPIPPEIWGQIVFGVVNDGGGLIIVGGRPVPVPPWGPITDILQALTALSAVQQIAHVETQNVQAALWHTIGTIAKAGEKGQLGGSLFG